LLSAKAASKPSVGYVAVHISYSLATFAAIRDATEFLCRGIGDVFMAE